MSALTPQQFVANWSNTQLKESASYITHFDDLCELVNHAKPAHGDKTGETFTYQKGALKSDGGQIIGHGFADVWFKDHFAIEYKGAGQHKTLTEAFTSNSCSNVRVASLRGLSFPRKDRYEDIPAKGCATFARQPGRKERSYR